MEQLKQQYEKSLKEYEILLTQSRLNRGTPAILLNLAKKRVEMDKKAFEDAQSQMKSSS
jgi:hypothetical protein